MHIPTYAELYLDARSNVVRRSSAGAELPPALRVCYTATMTPLLMTGTPSNPRFHDAKTIIAGLLTEADAFELPLPAPVQDPLYDAPMTERAMLLEFAAGLDITYLKNKYGPNLCRSATDGAANRETPIANASSIGPLILEVRDAMAREAREREASAQVAVALDSGMQIDAVRSEPEDPTQYGVITKASPQEYARMTRRAGTSARTDARVSWPFKDMHIGDRVVIDPKLAKRAQTAVHVYAARVGKRFKTEARGRGGALVVMRIEDRA